MAQLRGGARVGGYVVLDLLGQGGMAAVYRVRHAKLGSTHALKVVVVPSRQVMKRLMSEGQAQARLRHRNIVQVNDVIEVDGSPGLVMEYVPGPSLDTLLHNVTLDLASVDRLGRQLIRGIGAAHDAGLVHRDLKPANVLCSFEEDGLVPKIADFGLVKDLAEQGDTRTGSVMGTPNYMAPEQIRDTKSVDHRADLFSMGAVLYELLTGTLAFPGDDMLDVFNAVDQGLVTPIRDLRPDVPDRMVGAIERALRKRRDDRPGSARELLDLWCGDVADAALAPPELPQATVDWLRAATLVPPSTDPTTGGQTVDVDGYDPPPGAASTHTTRGVVATVIAGTGAVGAAVLLIAFCAGAGGLLAWRTTEEVVEVPPPPPEPVTRPGPGPDPEPELPVDIPPGPQPTPEPPKPGKAPPTTPQPVPAPPVPVVPVPIVPVPQPEPEPDEDLDIPTVGQVSVGGDPGPYLLENENGKTLSVGSPVPPGRYTLLADRGGAPTKMLVLTVTAGHTTRVSCKIGKCAISK